MRNPFALALRPHAERRSGAAALEDVGDPMCDRLEGGAGEMPRVVPRVIPVITPDLGTQWGEPSPVRAGTKTTPADSTLRARRFARAQSRGCRDRP